MTDEQFNNLYMINNESEDGQSSLIQVPKDKRGRKGKKNTETNNPNYEENTEKQDDEDYEEGK